MANVGMRGFQSIPPVIKNLLIANVVMWLAELTFKEPFVNALSLHYHESPDFGIWQIFTYMFMHDPSGIFHILFNMFGLWMFGSTLEDVWGAKKFLAFYLICGVGAGLIQMLTNYVEFTMLTSQVHAGTLSVADYNMRAGSIYYTVILGASGAIMGVFAAFAYLFPNTPLYMMPIPIPIKAKWWITGLILLDVFGGVNPRYGGGIAHFAHLGGALVGLILVIIMNRTNRRTFY
ncbi:MAG: rhomboid family intramembrane serine protease [Chitinophagaceae bacterium]